MSNKIKSSPICDMSRSLLMAQMLVHGGSLMLEHGIPQIVATVLEDDHTLEVLSTLRDLNEQAVAEIGTAYEAVIRRYEGELKPGVAIEAVGKALSNLECMHDLMDHESDTGLFAQADRHVFYLPDETGREVPVMGLAQTGSLADGRVILAGIFLSAIKQEMTGLRDNNKEDNNDSDVPSFGICHSVSVLHHSRHGIGSAAAQALRAFGDIKKPRKQSAPVRDMLLSLQAMQQGLPECSLSTNSEITEILSHEEGEDWIERTVGKYCDVVFAADRLIASDKCTEYLEFSVHKTVEAVQAWIAEAEIHQKEQERIAA